MTGDVYLKLLDIAVNEGIEIIDNKLDIENVNGLFIEDTKGCIVALNVNLADDPGKRNFVLAHELGHYFLHRKIGDLINKESSLYEEQADNYAYNLIKDIENNLLA